VKSALSLSLSAREKLRAKILGACALLLTWEAIGSLNGPFGVLNFMIFGFFVVGGLALIAIYRSDRYDEIKVTAFA
jgi:hypothetical protein